LVAVVAGIVLPQLLAGVTPPTPPPAPAQDTAQPGKLIYTPPAWPDGPDPKAMLLRLAFGTVVVLGLCVGTLWFGKRWLRGVPAKNAAGAQLSLVDTLALGNRCAVYLVKVGSRQVLVGADASGLKSLVPLVEPFESTMSEVQAGDEAEGVPVGVGG